MALSLDLDKSNTAHVIQVLCRSSVIGVTFMLDKLKLDNVILTYDQKTMGLCSGLG